MAARTGSLRSTVFRAMVGVAIAIPLGTSVVRAAPCSIKPRFQALVREIPDIVGKCLANETFDFSTGDIRQVTNRGELLMRAADGVAQFTDATNANQTWVAGPEGVLPRREEERFPWEAPLDATQELTDSSADSGADQTVVDTNANENTNNLANANVVTADGGDATGGTANAHGGSSTNTNTNTVNPVINVVVNVPPSAPTATVVPTPPAAITSTVLPTVVPTLAPIPAVAPALPAPTGQWVAWTSPSVNNEVREPRFIRVSSIGDIYVVSKRLLDRRDTQVQKFSPVDSCQCWWQFVTSFRGLNGNYNGYPVDNPRSIAIDLRNNLYIALENGGMQIFMYVNSDFSPLKEPFDAPDFSGIFVDSSNTIFTALTGTRIAFDGKVMNRWGGVQGSGPGQYKDARAVVVNQAGDIYVADTGNNRIQKVSGAGGRPLAQWGAKGSGPGQFEQPTDIALDAQGNIYVADSGNHRIQKLSPDGKFLQQWGNMGQFGNKPQEGTEPGQFKSPMGVAVDAKGNVYVADTGNNRIQKLTLNP